jgi:hypothetical protein
MPDIILSTIPGTIIIAHGKCRGPDGHSESIIFPPLHINLLHEFSTYYWYENEKPYFEFEK